MQIQLKHYFKFLIFFTIKNIRKMSNPEVAQVIQRQINNGQYSEAVDSINIVCSQPGNVLCKISCPRPFLFGDFLYWIISFSIEVVHQNCLDMFFFSGRARIKSHGFSYQVIVQGRRNVAYVVYFLLVYISAGYPIVNSRV